MAARRSKLPRQVPPRTIEREYAKRLVGRVVDPARKAYAPVVKHVARLAAAAKKDAKRDRLDADDRARLKSMLAAGSKHMERAMSTAGLDDLAEQVGNQTQGYQRTQLHRQVKSALGSDPTIRDKRLGGRIKTFVRENVSLVKRIPERLHDELSDLVETGAREAWLTPDLANAIAERFDIAEKHARLIARDQIGSLYADVNHDRQRELGVEKFVWRTVNDERVRGNPDGKYPDAEPSHWDLDGQVFSYDDPPVPDGADGPILPGDEIQCRCWAEPVLDDLLDEQDDEDQPDEGDDEESDEEDDDREDSTAVLISAVAKLVERVDALVGRMDFVEKRGSKWVVLNHDRTKVLGSYDTEAEARKRLGQIEYFKHHEDWDPDQPRDENGRFSSGEGGAAVKESLGTVGKMREAEAAAAPVPSAGPWTKAERERQAAQARIQANRENIANAREKFGAEAKEYAAKMANLPSGPVGREGLSEPGLPKAEYERRLAAQAAMNARAADLSLQREQANPELYETTGGGPPDSFHTPQPGTLPGQENLMMHGAGSEPVSAMLARGAAAQERNKELRAIAENIVAHESETRAKQMIGTEHARALIPSGSDTAGKIAAADRRVERANKAWREWRAEHNERREQLDEKHFEEINGRGKMTPEEKAEHAKLMAENIRLAAEIRARERDRDELEPSVHESEGGYDDEGREIIPPGKSVRAPREPVPQDPERVRIASDAAARDEFSKRVILSAKNNNPNSESANASWRVTLDDGSKALWKPAEGEEHDLRHGIDAGTYYKREEAFSRVAENLGVGDISPTTIVHTHEDSEGTHTGALQSWVEGEPARGSGVEFSKRDSERMRIADYVSGNTDRHPGNVLVRPGDEPGLIDHGLTFPSGLRDRFIQPWGMISHDPGPLAQDSIKQIQAINIPKLARTLHESGIDHEAVRNTVMRALHVKAHPEILQVPDRGPGNFYASGGHTWDRLAHEDLTEEHGSEADKIMNTPYVLGEEG